MKKILVIGVGLISEPLINYLLNSEGIFLTAVDKTTKKAEQLLAGSANGKVVKLDFACEKEKLNLLVSQNDLVVSLLPPPFHPEIAKLCLKHSKNLVTCSYVSDAMQTFDEEAKQKGLVFLNEVGLDPGIDHISAMKIIKKLQAKGGKILEFYSYCGGIPAPKSALNPFCYKFSWSPRGVVSAASSNGTFLKNGVAETVENKELFTKTSLVEIPNFGCLETYINRSSLPYIEKYGIEGVQNLYRGTLRYVGWSETWNTIVNLGLISESEVFDCSKLTKIDYLASLTKIPKNELREKLPKFLGYPIFSDALKRLEWLGFFSEEPIQISEGNRIDVFTSVLLEKLSYKENEEDLTVLYHKFVVDFGTYKEKITSTLIDYGVPGKVSSMAKLVGLTAGISAKLVACEKIKTFGVQIPVLPEIYEPILAELEKNGVCFEEQSVIFND